MYQQLIYKPVKLEPFTTFCQTDDFKKYVRGAINDQIFWNTFIKNEINERVQIEVNRIVPVKVDKELNHFEKYKIPEQIAAYLNNDYKIQQIITTQRSKLEEELQIKTKQILDKVTNEEQYHTVTNAHLGNMKNRFENQLTTFNQTMNEHLVLNNHLCQETIKNVHNRVNDELVKVNECIKKVNDLDTQVNQLKRENNIYWLLTFVSMSVATITAGVIVYKEIYS